MRELGHCLLVPTFAAVVLISVPTQAAEHAHSPPWDSASVPSGVPHRQDTPVTPLEDMDGLHLSNPTRADLRRFFQAHAPTQAHSDCQVWAASDSRAALFVPAADAGWLLVGEAGGPLTSGRRVDIRNIVRLYSVTSFTKSGGPLNGALSIKLPLNQMSAEQSCLQLLPGTRIAWPSLAHDPTDVGHAVEMLVDSVSFSRDGSVNSAGQVTATDQMIATLRLSEGWMPMAYRQTKEHAWGIAGGIAGSVFLVAVTAMLRRAVRHLRAPIRTAWQKLKSYPAAPEREDDRSST